MMRLAVGLAFALPLGGGCSSKPDAAKHELAPVATPTDAGVDGRTSYGHYDPASGAHLDDDVPGRAPPRNVATRPGRPIDITLRSSPGGAQVAVDGEVIGPTPAVWSGMTGGEHEFTFVYPGYAMARYRFTPITTGVVHAKLDPLVDETSDAGVPELVPPGIPRGAPPAVPPPATLVSPGVEVPPVRPSPPPTPPPPPTTAPTTAPTDAAMVVPVDATAPRPIGSGAGPQP